MLLIFVIVLCGSIQIHGYASQCSANEICRSCSCVAGLHRDINGECVPLHSECGGDPNAVPYDCTGPCPQSCDTINELNPCPLVCVPDQICTCIDGLIKGPNGRCIPKSECPRRDKCSENETYSCSIDVACSDYRKGFNKRFDDCEEGCNCKDGFARNELGKCVPIDECCTDPNSELVQNAISCPGNTCHRPDHRKCLSTPYELGCRCKKDYVRVSEANATCIRKSACII